MEELGKLRARLSTYEVQTMLTALDDLYEAAKEDLVGCNPQDFIGKQAEAKTYRDLVRKIRSEPPIPQE